MKKIFFLSILIFSILSCRTSKLESPYLINLPEANRILENIFKKSGIINTSKHIVLINKELQQNNIINYDTTIIKDLDLGYFKCIKNNYKIKLINKNEIKSEYKIIGYWNITFRKLNNGLLNVGISSDFFIPPARQPIEVYGMYYYFIFKIVKGKAKLIRWRGM